MDYSRIDDVLSRANAEFERKELEDLRFYEVFDDEIGDEPSSIGESYVGTGGTVPPDYSPSGPPDVPSVVGPNNFSGDIEPYLSYISNLTLDISGMTGASEDDVLNAIDDVAAMMVDDGVLPPMPDAETSTADEIALWLGGAQTSDFSDRIIKYVRG